MRNKVYALIILGSDDDICEYTIKHLLYEGIDKILIDLVPVEDNTKDIVYDLQRRHPEKIEIFPSKSIEIWGSRRMTRLANIAYDRGVELVIPCDADEMFVSRQGNLLADEVRNAPGFLWGIPILSHLSAPDDDQNEHNPYKRMRWRTKEPLRLNKIIVRFNNKMVIDEGNHGVKWNNGDQIQGSWIPIDMRHFSYRSVEQFEKKVRVAEKAMEATKGYPAGWGVQYRMYADTLRRAGSQALADWFNLWCKAPTPNPDEIMLDPAPWRADGL
jgi:hypothetical protein